MTTEEITLPQQFTHSVKLEGSAKGVRVSIHIYANNRYDAIQEALLTLVETKELGAKHNVVFAPVEISPRK